MSTKLTQMFSPSLFLSLLRSRYWHQSWDNTRKERTNPWR